VTSWLKTLLAGVAAGLLMTGLVACGGDDESSTSDGTSAGNVETADSDAENGEAAGKAAGDPVALPKIKAGILNLGRVSESGGRAEDTLTAALDEIGWEHVRCDSQGNPAEMARCGDTLLGQNVDVMYLIAIPPTAIQSQLKAAKAKNVPVLSFAGAITPSPLVTAAYDSVEEETGPLLAEHMIEQLKDVEGEKQIAIHSSVVAFAANREASFRKTIETESDIKVVDTKEVDPADSIGSTQRNVAAQLDQYPDLDAIVTTWDDAIVGAARAVQQKKPNAQFPDRPLLLSFDAVKGTIPWMKRGVVDAVSDVDFATPAWVAVDQAAEFFARQTEISEDPQYDGIEQIMEPQIITKDNLPPEGEYVPPPFDAQAYFGAKWQTEFTK
jgi:ABC-type sugar transport system substrate-binding protein